MDFIFIACDVEILYLVSEYICEVNIFSVRQCIVGFIHSRKHQIIRVVVAARVQLLRYALILSCAYTFECSVDVVCL